MIISLVDIIPQKRVVELAAGELELHGLGLRQIADLFVMFPNLRNIFVNSAPEIGPVEIMVGAPEAIGTIIAQAARQPEAADRIVDVGPVISPEEFFPLLEAVYDLTFPRGVSPFLEKLTDLLLKMGVLVPRQSGRDQVTDTPPPPRNSLPPDMLAAK